MRMTRPDILILGGGIIGCALAEELARRGAHVTLLEQGLIGREASLAAAGVLCSQLDVLRPGPFFDACQEARRRYPGWIQRLRHVSGQPIEFRAGGVLYLAAYASQARRMAGRARWQRRLGCRVEALSMAAIRRLEPAIDGRFHSGFLFPMEGQVDNGQVMTALAVVCRKSRVRIREHHRVRRLLIRQGAVQGVETDRGMFSARVVVNTLGSWANLDGDFPVRLPVEPARGQILCFVGSEGLFRRPVITDRAYLVQRDDGRVLLGSTVERVGFDKSLTAQGMHAILCSARRISTKLETVRFLDAWAGLRPYAAKPLMGPTKITGLYVATGHFRHGILLAPMAAQRMADLLLTGRTAIDATAFLPP